MAMTTGHLICMSIPDSTQILIPDNSIRRSNELFRLRRQKSCFRRNILNCGVKMQMKNEDDKNAGVDILKMLSQTLWGKGLPPQILVGTVRTVWSSGWKIMMKQMAPSDPTGSYRRPDSSFRGRPSNPVESSEIGRYHLYAALACPWAHRTLIVRALKGLEDAVGVSIASAGVDGPWQFSGKLPTSPRQDASNLGPTGDNVNNCKTLKEVYRLRKRGYDGRATVPMLWDAVKKDVVNNESADIIAILNSDFNNVAKNPDLDLSPPSLRDEIQRWNDIIYPNVNNGVYRCGFAQSQEAYEIAVQCLFNTLDGLEAHLAASRYLCGDCLTLADIRLFTTLFRFDPVYHILFKCSKRKLSEYPNLYGYMLDIYQMPRVASTCDLQAIMDGYYRILFPLNPGGIQPVAPLGFDRNSLHKSHNRELVSLSHANI
eukprot:Gb_29988 [translate_table: standard]